MTGRKKKDIEERHSSEQRMLEENYQRDILEFNSIWDDKSRELEERAKKEEDELNETHQREEKELYENIEHTLPRVLKYSKEYLDLKQVEANLVKQERYIEAHFIKTKCEALVTKENSKFSLERNDKIKIKLEQSNKKQQNEKNQLKQKFILDYEVLRKERDAETEKLIHRYKNKKLDLDMQQKQEKNLTSNQNMLKASKLYLFISETMATMIQMTQSKRTVVTKSEFDPEMRLKELSKKMKRRYIK